jgi:hypothetical protein
LGKLKAGVFAHRVGVTNQLDKTKGVVCAVRNNEDMPTDEHGNRADAVIYGISTVKRMNFGRFYEQFINAASRDLLHRMREQAGLQPKIKPTAYQLKQLESNEALIDDLWGQLMRYYEIVAPLQHDLLIDDPDHWRHVRSVLADEGGYHDGIYLWVPPDNPVNNLAMAKALMESEFRPHYGPVTYRDNAGEMVTTVNPVLIGSLYMIMLEKTGEDWSGVASVKTNHFGVPAKLNNYDKQTSPGRQAPVRALGESETRSYISTVGAQATMELLDQSNNHATHSNAIENIIKAPKPTNIDKVVDRKKVPFGGSRPVALVRHVLNCRGIRFVYRSDHTDDNPNSL